MFKSVFLDCDLKISKLQKHNVKMFCYTSTAAVNQR